MWAEFNKRYCGEQLNIPEENIIGYLRNYGILVLICTEITRGGGGASHTFANLRSVYGMSYRLKYITYRQHSARIL
jgi:hypothetical protein